jgi:type VI secretion system protein ImpG
MRDDLLEYYERELTYIRRLGAEFGRRYPRVAGALQLEPTKSDDPHVERLLEGFAFLAARVHLKLDDEFPVITEALFETIYPEYSRPIPSLSLAQFHLDPEQGKLTGGFRIPRDTPLNMRSANGVACRFQTSYDTTLWPLDVTEASWTSPHQLQPPVRASDAVAALKVVLRSPPDLPIGNMGLDTLRFHVNAEPNVAAALYELLCNNCVRILLRRPGAANAERDTVSLAPSSLRPLGFEPDEGVLPIPRRSFVGYRLLTEYFAFPEKFYFFDLSGLEPLSGSGGGSALEIVFLISRFERGERRALLEGAVRADTIRLGCTPVVNLFRRASEPVLLSQRRAEYMVVPDAQRRNAVEIYSVEDVTAVTPGRGPIVHFAPLYSHRHGATAGEARHFWTATRRPRGWHADDGWDVFLSFADLDGTTVHPDVVAVTARVLCHNGDLPSRLPIGDPDGDFDVPGGAPIRRVAALVQPTSLVQPPVTRGLLWRLASFLSLNFVSLVDGGVQTLQELLRLHDPRQSAAGEKQIQAILALAATPMHTRLNVDGALAFARGHRVDLELDEEQFAGGGVYLFSSVLERFLGLYTSLNSFNVLRLKTRQRREIMKEWPPRAGWKTLV